MKANRVLKLLKVTRQTLTSYVKNGKLKVKTNVNGFYNIIRKEVDNVAIPVDRGFVFNPVKISF